MAYGSGAPSWSRGREGSSNLNNRFNGPSSYQAGGGNAEYTPPMVSRTYADQQTHVMEDTMKTLYEVENTAGNVQGQLYTQRQQLEGTSRTVNEMRDATERSRREIAELTAKRDKKRYQLLTVVGMYIISIDLVMGSFGSSNKILNVDSFLHSIDPSFL
jgi:hypothetical protein